MSVTTTPTRTVSTEHVTLIGVRSQLDDHERHFEGLELNLSQKHSAVMKRLGNIDNALTEQSATLERHSQHLSRLETEVVSLNRKVDSIIQHAVTNQSLDDVKTALFAHIDAKAEEQAASMKARDRTMDEIRDGVDKILRFMQGSSEELPRKMTKTQ